MEKYILIGIPNCGKSTLGKRSAETLRMPFFDTDLLAVEKMNLEHPAEIFRFAFNGRFLTEQYNVMIDLAAHKGTAIIATGAEIALMPECADLIKKMGTIIHIKRKPSILLNDYKNSGKRGIVMRQEKRNGDEESEIEIDMQEENIKIYAKEITRYEALANLTLENNGSEDEGLERLIELIRSDPAPEISGAGKPPHGGFAVNHL